MEKYNYTNFYRYIILCHYLQLHINIKIESYLKTLKAFHICSDSFKLLLNYSLKNQTKQNELNLNYFFVHELGEEDAVSGPTDINNKGVKIPYGVVTLKKLRVIEPQNMQNPYDSDFSLHYSITQLYFTILIHRI